MNGELTFLGTGTSMGVPTLGCECEVCTSTDPHDKRLRPSVLVRWSSTPADAAMPVDAPASVETTLHNVVIDTGPDFRAQALQIGLKQVDAVFYTHAHADHILGLDDLRPLSFEWHRKDGPIPLYATAETSAVLNCIFAYTFSPLSTYPTRARVALHLLQDHNPIGEVDFVSVPVRHGEMMITGYRVGRMAYLTDVSAIPESSFALLEGLDVLVLSALRHKPHPSHTTVEQALAWAARIGAKQTWFTHIAHELGHAATNRMLPKGVALAYDGLTLPVTLS